MNETEPKRLYRSNRDRMVSGVCGGVAEYFNIDPAIVRIVWVVSCFTGGIGIILYLAALVIVPLNPEQSEIKKKESGRDSKAFIGALLIVLGIIIFAGRWGCHFAPWTWGFSWMILGPIALIIIGLALIFFRGRDNEIPPADGVKRLYRRGTGRMLLGVASGTADYFHIDPTIARLCWAGAFFITGGVMVIVYFILYFVLPESNQSVEGDKNV